MKNGLEVKNIIFGEMRKISSKEFRKSIGIDITWDELVDGAGIKLILANSSEETKKPYIYIVSKPDIPTEMQTSFGTDMEVKPREEKEINYVVPMYGITSSDYRNYTGPLRYVVTVRVSESVQGEVLEKKVKYYDIPAEAEADELEESKFDINKALDELARTTILQDFHIEGSPKGDVKSINAKLFNFGEKTQYIGIDIRAERRSEGGGQWGCQTQFFYEVGPKEEIPVDFDFGLFIPGKVPPEYLWPEYLRIRAVSIPEQVFLSKRARAWFLWRSYEEEENYKSLLAKLDLYFRQGE
jgi:hypothetical protein